MKKKIISIFSIILFMCLICNITYATETNITLQKDKEKYTGGDVVQVSVKVNDITLENGIETIIGKVSYNKELYESCIIEESNSWEADYNDQNGKIILQRNEAIKENHTAFVIKLTIKDNVVNNDTISFTDINIADENTDLFPVNATTSITIENIETGDGEEQEGDPNEKTLTGIEVSSDAIKIEYNAGDKFEKAGLIVKAKYSDGSSKEITDYTIENGDKLTAGQTSVTISYTENGVTKTTTQAIKVVEKNISNDKKDEDKSDFEEIKEDETKTENKMPDTGVSSVIGIMVVIAVFGVVCLARYNKYKKI